MVDLARIGWLPLFEEMRQPNAFLTRQFSMKPGGAVKGQKIAIDIMRSGSPVAVVVRKMSGPNFNDVQSFTTKTFEPPGYNEGFPIEANELLSRTAGVDPFSAAYMDYYAQLIAVIARGFTKVGDMINRAIELQASQVLQTGKLNLTDKTNAVVYELDYSPKVAHFPTNGTAWSGGAANILADLENLAAVIRTNGKVNPDQVIVGKNALRYMLKDTEIKARLDNRNFEAGKIAPELQDSGATLMGMLLVGTSYFQVWAYEDVFDAPDTGTATPFVGDNKVIMKSSRTRLDIVAAEPPPAVAQRPELIQFMPGRMTSQAGGFDFTPNVFTSLDGKQLFGALESRPLLIPVQIDGFGCLTVT